MRLFIPVLLYFFHLSRLLFAQTTAPDSLRNRQLTSFEVTAPAPRYFSIQPQANLEFKEELKKLSPGKNLSDLLEGSGKVNIQISQPGGGSAVIRGFEANKIVLVLDGIRLNNAIYRSGHHHYLNGFDPISISSLLIEKGSGSTQYGSDALGGSIVMRSRWLPFTDSLKTQMDIAAGLNSRGGFKGHIAVQLQNKKFSALSSVSWLKNQNQFMGKQGYGSFPDFGLSTFSVERINQEDSVLTNERPTEILNSAYQQLYLQQKIRFYLNEYRSLSLNGMFGLSSVLNRNDRLSEWANHQPRFSEWYYSPQKQGLIYGMLETVKATPLSDESRISFAWQGLREGRNERSFNDSLLYTRTEKVQVYSLQADWKKKSGKTVVHYGFELAYNSVRSAAQAENITTSFTGKASTRYPDGGSEVFDLGFFTLLEYPIGINTYIQAGARFGYHYLQARFVDTSFYSFPFEQIEQKNWPGSIQAAVLGTSQNGDHYGLSVSSGFRSPNLDDLAKIFDSQPGQLILPNPDLKAEYTLHPAIEAGTSPSRKIHLNIEAWYTWYFRSIQTGPAQFNGEDTVLYQGQPSKVFSSFNAGRAALLGGSADLVYRISTSLSAEFTIQYTRGRLETDSGRIPLDHIPPISGRVGITYKSRFLDINLNSLFNLKKESTEYGSLGEDNLRYAPEGGIPAWYIFNFSIQYPLSDQIRMMIEVQNITDTRYRTFASGVNAPGRLARFSLIWSGLL